MTQVAGRSLALRALVLTESDRPSSFIESHGGDTRSRESDRKSRLDAIRYVIETGKVYRPLADKWQRGRK